jgi:hypothetical protein
MDYHSAIQATEGKINGILTRCPSVFSGVSGCRSLLWVENDASGLLVFQGCGLALATWAGVLWLLL